MLNEVVIDYDRKVARRIERTVRANHKNQSWLARLFGMSPAAINKRFRTRSPRYSIGEVILLCKELEVPIEEIIAECVEDQDTKEFEQHLAYVNVALMNETNPDKKLSMLRTLINQM